MKILIVSYNPNPSLGGVWRIVSQSKELLERLNHEVDILSLDPKITKYHIIDRQPEIFISQLSPFISKKVKEAFPTLHSNPWIYNAEINRYALEMSALYYGLKKYDLIHAQDVMAARAISRVKPDKTPLITSAHGYLSGAIFYHLKGTKGHENKTDDQIKNLLEYKYHNTLEYQGYHSSDFVHTDSKWMRKKVENEFSVSPNKLFTFPYGMDTKTFFKHSHGDSNIYRPKDKKVILFTGRFVYLKGVQYLLDSLRKLKLQRNDWECWLLGEGLLQNELKAQCKKLGVQSDVKFLGVSNNILHFLKQADIFVLPSLQDNQPYSVMEAMLFGVPVIVSDAAGLPEMVLNGNTGFIVPTGNSQSLYERLNYLLENDLVRKQLGDQAKKWAQSQWSTDKMIKNTLDMYDQGLHK